MNSTLKVAGLAVLSFTLGGSMARAADAGSDGMEQMKRHAEAMIGGLPHDEARKATTRVSGEEAAPMAVQRKHVAAMLTGMSHDEARKASAVDLMTQAELEKVNTRARKMGEALQTGRTYDEARKATGDM